MRLSRSLAFVALVTLLPPLALACNTPREASDAPTVVAPAASAPPPASSSGPAVAPVSSPPPPGACTKDSDCRTFASYCQEAPCACRALPSSAPDPTCAGGAPSKVRCFADPCMKKAASCQAGACVLTVK